MSIKKTMDEETMMGSPRLSSSLNLIVNNFYTNDLGPSPNTTDICLHAKKH